MEKTTKTKVTKVKSKRSSTKPVLLQFLYTVDDLCYGKTATREQRQKFISTLYEAYSEQDSKAKVLAYEEMESFLKKEIQTAKIRRIFPEYHGDEASLTTLLQKYNGPVSLLLAVICLSDWQVKLDFKKDIVQVGQALGILSQIYRTYECYREIQEAKKVLPKYFVELQALRDIANSLSLVGSFQILPEVTLQLIDDTASLKILTTAIKRFPVIEELKIIEGQYQKELQNGLADITDFIADYTASDQRKKALLSLPTLCKKYIEQS